MRHNSKLTALDCKNSRLSSLVLNEKAKLDGLNYAGNPLTKVDIQYK